MCGLRWRDIDWEKSEVAILRRVIKAEPEPLVKDLTKTGKTRRIPLDDGTIAALREHRQRFEDRATEIGVAPAKDAFVFSDARELGEHGLGHLHPRPHVGGSFRCRPDGRSARRLRGRRHDDLSGSAGGYPVTVAMEQLVPAELEAAVARARSRSAATGELRAGASGSAASVIPGELADFVERILTDGTYAEAVARIGEEDPDLATI